MPDVIHVPLDAILDDLIPRDRGPADPAALDDLTRSILTDGLRQPIELMPFEEPADGRTHALLSGFRRLSAFRRLAADFPGKFATIPAFERPVADMADALRQMVEENAIRAEISPWDQARIAVETVPQYFPSIDAAVAALYKSADRQRRARIRAVAEVVESLGHLLRGPEHLSMRQLERLAAACRGGFTDLIDHALRHSHTRDPAGQWLLLSNILSEAEHEARTPEPPDPRPDRPRRFTQPRADLWVRREKTREGWNLRFTGREATGPLMEDIMDAVERLVGR